MANPFKAIVNFLKKVPAILEHLFSREVRDKIADYLERAQELLEPALTSVEIIASLTPNRKDNEIVALAKKYGLGTVTPALIRNEAALGGILLTAAVKELKKRTGTDIPDDYLRTVVQAAFNLYKLARA